MRSILEKFGFAAVIDPVSAPDKVKRTISVFGLTLT